jgi:hypothetical protein
MECLAIGLYLRNGRLVGQPPGRRLSHTEDQRNIRAVSTRVPIIIHKTCPRTEPGNKATHRHLGQSVFGVTGTLPSRKISFGASLTMENRCENVMRAGQLHDLCRSLTP